MDHHSVAPRRFPAGQSVNHKIAKLKNNRRKFDLKRSVAVGLLDLSPSQINKRQLRNQMNEVTKCLGKLDLKTRLPKKYALLVELFKWFEFNFKLLKIRGLIPTFSKLKPMIDNSTRRSFTYTDLAHLKFFFYDEIGIDSVVICNRWNASKKLDLDITLKIDDFEIMKKFENRVIKFYNSTPKDADIPTPMLVFDQDTHHDQTILHVSYAPFLLPHDFIHTMIITPLKDLGLDVSKQTPESQHQPFITRLSIGRKVDDPFLLENIRLTIISNLLKYPPPPVYVDITTSAHAKDDHPKQRPELLLERMADVNLNVEAAVLVT